MPNFDKNIAILLVEFRSVHGNPRSGPKYEVGLKTKLKSPSNHRIIVICKVYERGTKLWVLTLATHVQDTKYHKRCIMQLGRSLL
jgi:hypothetical protein